MKIISKFYDYYDKINAYGVDETVYYHRKERKIDLKNDYIPWSGYLKNFNIYEEWFSREELQKFKIKSTQLYYIGVCGVIYPMVLVKYYSYNNNIPDKIFYEPDKLFNNLKDNNFFINRNPMKYRNNINEFFNQARYKKSNYLKFFQEYHCPVFIVATYNYTDAALFINPKLDDFHFQAIKDPFTLHQEIAGYISGFLGTKEHELVQISDISMRDKKGFDKWSFKKKKTKRLTKHKK